MTSDTLFIPLDSPLHHFVCNVRSRTEQSMPNPTAWIGGVISRRPSVSAHDTPATGGSPRLRMKESGREKEELPLCSHTFLYFPFAFAPTQLWRSCPLHYCCECTDLDLLWVWIVGVALLVLRSGTWRFWGSVDQERKKQRRVSWRPRSWSLQSCSRPGGAGWWGFSTRKSRGKETVVSCSQRKEMRVGCFWVFRISFWWTWKSRDLKTGIEEEDWKGRG